MIGTAVHYGIEQCLNETMMTGEPLSQLDSVDSSMGYWNEHSHEIDNWNHTRENAEEIIEANTKVWWNEVMPDIRPIAVEEQFEVPLTTLESGTEVWLTGTIDCVQEFPYAITDWKNPGGKPRDEWLMKRWSVQAAAYTYAVNELYKFGEPLPFEFVHLVKGKVHRTTVNFGPAEWESLVALAHSAGTLIEANLSTWPLNMAGWWCSPKWCGAWKTCRGQYAGQDPF
tara:strand:+ start:101 stop:781 length:681 start_codon:yes stop_codon:yes gene_type:complete